MEQEKYPGIERLLGEVVVKIDDMETGSECVTFTCESGLELRLEYFPDCCASCSLVDFQDDKNDLIGMTILIAEEVSNFDEPYAGSDSYTWVFYKLATVKGYVTLRFLGESSGYYSETVDVVVTEPGQPRKYSRYN